MKKTLSIILCLAMLMSAMPGYVFAAPTMMPTGSETVQEVAVDENKTTQEDELQEQVVLAAGDYEVTFDAATTETVVDMPQGTTASGSYTLPTTAPSRSGYAFEGWSKELGGSIIKADTVSENTTYYAVWSRLAFDEDFLESTSTPVPGDYFGKYYEFMNFNSQMVTPPEGTASIANGKFILDTIASNANAATGAMGVRFGVNVPNIKISDISKIAINVTFRDTNGNALLATSGYNLRYYYTTDEGYSYDSGTLYPTSSGQYGMTFNADSITLNPVANNVFNGHTNEHLTSLTFRLAGNTDAVRGKVDSVEVDYIKIHSKNPIKDIPAIDITGVGTPSAEDVASTISDIKAGSNAYSVTGFEWEGGLIGDMFFNGGTVYTAKVSLSAKEGYAFPQGPGRVTIDEKTATYSRISDSQATVTYEFGATEDVGEVASAKIFLHAGDDVTERAVIANKDFDTAAIIPENIPEGKLWEGWSATEGGTQAVNTVSVVENSENHYYAIFNTIERFILIDKYHHMQLTPSRDGVLKFENGVTVVTPNSSTDDVYFVTPEASLLSTIDYGMVDVYYDATLTSDGVANKFNADFTPDLYFTTSDNTEYVKATLSSVTDLSESDGVVVYRYDLMSSDEWTGNVGSLKVDPYDGYPAWSAMLVEFVKNVEIEGALVITDIDAPETFATPDTDVTVGEDYIVKSVQWSPEMTEYGAFKPLESYTATIVVRPASGKKIVSDVAFVGENEASAVINADGTITITYTFTETKQAVDFEFTLDDGAIDVQDGTLQLVPNFTCAEGEVVPDTAVTWEIIDNGANGKCATIDENGVLTAHYNGEVVVKATSLYNPQKTATATYILTNQFDGYAINYDARTTETVANMPQGAVEKGEYVLSTLVPSRDGYVFLGWTKDPDAQDVEYVGKTDDIEDETTYYAVWSRMFYNQEFDVSASNPSAEDYFDKKVYFSSAWSDNRTGTTSFAISNGKAVFTDNFTGVNVNQKLSSFDLGVTLPNIKISDIAKIEMQVAFKDADGNVLNTTNSYQHRFWYTTTAGTSYDSTTQYTSGSGQFGYVCNANGITLTMQNGMSLYSGSPAMLAQTEEYIDSVTFRLTAKGNLLGNVKTIEVDYIKVYPKNTKDIANIDISGIAEPKAGEQANTDTSLITTAHDTYTVTDVEWQGDDLLGGLFFNGSSNYAVSVTLKATSGYLFPEGPVSVKIDGKDATYEKISESQAKVSYSSYPTTEDVGNLEIATIVLHEGETSVNNVVLAGKDFNIGAIKPQTIPEGHFFEGWSATEGGAVAETVINVTGDENHYYAIYVKMDTFDFSKDNHVEAMTSSSAGSMTADNGWLVVNPGSETENITLSTPKTCINASDYSLIEVIYNGNLEGISEGIVVENKFNLDTKPALYFTVGDATEEYPAQLVDVEKVVVLGDVAYKYTYDVSLSDSWTGEIGKVILNPYAGYPQWAVSSIKLVKSVEIEDKLIISDITKPVTWETPDTEISVNDGFEVVSFNWLTEMNTQGKFNSGLAYEMELVVKPVPGMKIVKTDAVVIVDEAEVAVDSAIINEDGTMTVRYTFPETDTQVKFTMALSNGAVVGDQPLTLVADYIPENEGEVVPNTQTIWEIIDNGANGKCATIDENGVLTGVYDGTVVVKATSVYNPEISTVAEFTISGQVNGYRIIYDANTTATVDNMPEEDYEKLDYTLSKQVPTREGCIFAGWAKSPDSTTYVYNDYITGDTTYYAIWVRGLTFEFSDSADKPGTVANGKQLYINDAHIDKNSLVIDEENGTLKLTTKGTDPQLSVGSDAAAALFKGSDLVELEIRFKTNRTRTDLWEWYFTSVDAGGNPLGEKWTNANPTDYVNNRIQFNVATVADEFTTVKVKTTKADWLNGYVNSVRVDLPNFSDVSFEIDYIRLIAYENVVANVEGVDAPVAKEIADTTATCSDGSVEVVSVEWSPELLFGSYFDGGEVYTARVTVKGVSGQFISSNPEVATVNGLPADGFEYNAEDGTLTLLKTFTATDEVESNEGCTLTLMMKDDNSNVVEGSKTLFKNSTFDLGKFAATSFPAGYRWIGWTAVEGDAENLIGEIDILENTTYYAVYEKITEFDYSKFSHRVGTTTNYGDERLMYTDMFAVVTPKSKSAEVSLTTPVTKIDASEFGIVEVYLSATYNSTNEGVEYENRINTGLIPTFKFSKADNPTAFSNSGTYVSGEKVLIGDELFYKFTYDMTTSSAWTGKIGAFSLKTYNGYPDWAVGKIVFVANEAITEGADITLNAPKTWESPDFTQTSINDKYEVVSVEYSPSVNDKGVYEAQTQYTVSVTYKAAVGYRVTSLQANINNKPAAVADNGNGTYTASCDFTTEALNEVEVVISGTSEISESGRYYDYKGYTRAIDGSAIPQTGVVWSVDDESVAVILEDTGRLLPQSNGTVTVIATSIYDPTVSASYTVTIENQKDLATVTFDANVQGGGVVAPQPVKAIGTFDPTGFKATRNGYVLEGWKLDEDGLEPLSSVEITSDTTLYAHWIKSSGMEFDDAADGNRFTISNITSKSVDTEKGVYKFTATGGSQSIFEMGANSGSPLFDGGEVDTVDIRISKTADSNNVTYRMFFTSKDDDGNFLGETYGQNSYDYETTNRTDAKVTAPKGQFAVISNNMTVKADWINGNVMTLRLDIPASANTQFEIDYIRFPINNRSVRFDANGGLIPMTDEQGNSIGSVTSFKETYKLGTITINAVPERDGYVFMGWSKTTDNHKKIYSKTSFVVSDDITLYAVWMTEQEAEEYNKDNLETEQPENNDDIVVNVGGSDSTGNSDRIKYDKEADAGSVTTHAAKTQTLEIKDPEGTTTTTPTPTPQLPQALPVVNEYTGSEFRDVHVNDWFYEDVEKAYELGLMNGKSKEEFDPSGTVTLAEVITVAARVNAIKNDKYILTIDGPAWYMPYVEYAISSGIISYGQYQDYEAVATRKQVAEIFASAMTNDWYVAINNFTKIPDVDYMDLSYEAILKLYNAGVIIGVDEEFNFAPDSKIRRRELAAIINRVADPQSRKKV